MIGAVVKIGEAELARRDNIHYLGMRSYEELPRYLAHFDAAILPFALNEATRFISPTKTLEYLAGGKPVISTPIKDVIDLYVDVVEIADTPDGFVHAIQKLWSESPVEKSFRRHAVSSVLAQHHWDVIALRMQRLIREVLAGRSTLNSLIQETHLRETPSFSSAPSVVGD
jgi:UDP-galactopyranose mutase